METETLHRRLDAQTYEKMSKVDASQELAVATCASASAALQEKTQLEVKAREVRKESKRARKRALGELKVTEEREQMKAMTSAIKVNRKDEALQLADLEARQKKVAEERRLGATAEYERERQLSDNKWMLGSTMDDEVDVLMGESG